MSEKKLFDLGELGGIPVIGRGVVGGHAFVRRLVSAGEVNGQFLGRIKRLEAECNDLYDEIKGVYDGNPAMQMSWTVNRMMMLISKASEICDLLREMVGVYSDAIGGAVKDLESDAGEEEVVVDG